MVDSSTFISDITGDLKWYILELTMITIQYF